MRRITCRKGVVLLIAAVLGAAAPALAAGPGTYRAADPGARVVTGETLLESERFWPYRVSLLRDWKPDGRSEPLRAGARGILVRVEPNGLARVDFAREGRFAVPIDALDVVALANRVRNGEEPKLAPLFVHTIGTRLVDSEAATLRAIEMVRVYEPRVFLAVFADPSSDGFAGIARSLAPLRDAHGAMTVLFPQGRHPDATVHAKLRALGWPVAFLRDEYGEGYTRSLRGESAPLPAVMVLTPEGRVLFDRPWSGEESVSDLRRAIEKHAESEPGQPSRATSAP